MKGFANFFILIISLLIISFLSLYSDEFSILGTNITDDPATICTYKNSIAYSIRIGDSNFVYLSIDKGNSWKRIFSERRNYSLPFVGRIGDLKIINDSTILFTLEKGSLYVTKNNGNNWSKIIPDPTNLNSGAFKIHVVNNRPYLYTFNKFLKSDDNYEKWDELLLPIFIDDSSVVLNLQVFDNNNLIAKIKDKLKLKIYRKIDISTLNYIDIKLPKFIDECFFINNNIGWSWYRSPLIYDSTYPKNWNNQIIYKTIDGGKTWIKKLDTNFQLYTQLIGVKFLDERTGFAYGESLTIMYTDDGGENWVPVNKDSLISKNIYYIYNFEILDKNNAMFTASSKLFFLKRNTNSVFELNDNEDIIKQNYIINKGTSLEFKSDFEVQKLTLISSTGSEIINDLRFINSNDGQYTIEIPSNISNGIYFLFIKGDYISKFIKLILN